MAFALRAESVFVTEELKNKTILKMMIYIYIKKNEHHNSKSIQFIKGLYRKK